ncbi:hypothetical protein WA026_023084 [Henosepilachna vigintioctopunctata]|uniref:RRM domain-containing protein n=1 Tax=Henosepilachna vigintioctopunctata TaxID=420089 RepID=A0AAW1UDD5_9CUCU
MENRNFFETIEGKLGINIPQRIKSHLKFHSMDSFPVAAKLNEKAILDIESFARDTLHEILQPDEMVEFYGSHFQKKPTLFVFTLGERMHLNEITQLCKDICDRKELFPNECEVNSHLTKLTEKLTISPEHSGPQKQNVETKNFNETKNRGIKKRRKASEQKIILLGNLEANTTVKELRDLVKKFGPTKKVYLWRDQNTGLCNGVGSVEFESSVAAAEAIKGLKGIQYKNNILKAKYSRPNNQ